MAPTLVQYLLVPITLTALVSLAHGDDHDDGGEADTGVVSEAGADADAGGDGPICVESYCGVSSESLAPRELGILVDSSGSLHDPVYNKWNSDDGTHAAAPCTENQNAHP